MEGRKSCEIIQAHFPELKALSFGIERACSVPNTMDKNGTTLEDIIIKFQNTGDKGETLQASRKKKISHIQRIQNWSAFGFPTINTAA